jgi:hypothetical protein
LYSIVEEQLRNTLSTPVLRLSPLQLRGLGMESVVRKETFGFSVPLVTDPDVKALYHSSALDTSYRIANEDMPFECDLPPNPLVTVMMARPPSC